MFYRPNGFPVAEPTVQTTRGIVPSFIVHSSKEPVLCVFDKSVVNAPQPTVSKNTEGIIQRSMDLRTDRKPPLNFRYFLDVLQSTSHDLPPPITVESVPSCPVSRSVSCVCTPSSKGGGRS